jgi:hypothetical protein
MRMPPSRIESESSGGLPPDGKRGHALHDSNQETLSTQRIRELIPWQEAMIQTDSLF